MDKMIENITKTVSFFAEQMTIHPIAIFLLLLFLAPSFTIIAFGNDKQNKRLIKFIRALHSKT